MPLGISAHIHALVAQGPEPGVILLSAPPKQGFPSVAHLCPKFSKVFYSQPLSSKESDMIQRGLVGDTETTRLHHAHCCLPGTGQRETGIVLPLLPSGHQHGWKSTLGPGGARRVGDRLSHSSGLRVMGLGGGGTHPAGTGCSRLCPWPQHSALLKGEMTKCGLFFLFLTL